MALFHCGSFEIGDGTKAEQSGQLKNLGPNDDGESVTGSFSYVAPDGVTYSVTYIADENGFQPQGSHLNQISEAIARSIEYNKAHPEEEKSRKWTVYELCLLTFYIKLIHCSHSEGPKDLQNLCLWNINLWNIWKT